MMIPTLCDLKLEASLIFCKQALLTKLKVQPGKKLIDAIVFTDKKQPGLIARKIMS